MASILKVDTIQDQSGNNIINENADTITIGASGDTVTIPSGASMTVPSGGLSGQNYPAFEAFLSANQSISNDTVTKCNINAEVFDTDSCYDNSVNYRFTPNVAGKYFLYGQVTIEGLTDAAMQIRIYENGSFLTLGSQITGTSSGSNILNVTTIVEANGTTDYYELFCWQEDGASRNLNGNASTKRSFFGAFRIGA
jgi:hypothetical protein